MRKFNAGSESRLRHHDRRNRIDALGVRNTHPSAGADYVREFSGGEILQSTGAPALRQSNGGAAESWPLTSRICADKPVTDRCSKLNIGDGVQGGIISRLRELSRRDKRSYKHLYPMAGFKPPEERL